MRILYVFNDQTVEGYRGININSRENVDPLLETHTRDSSLAPFMDQDPFCFHFQLSVSGA